MWAKQDIKSGLIIKKASKEHFADWAQLMHDYFAYYKFEYMGDHLEKTFEKIISDNPEIYSFVAYIDGNISGIANYLFHPSTFVGNECYLSDLFVSVDYRGCGVARKLIENVRKMAILHDATELYWVTELENQAAINLYDKIAIKNNEWARYEIDLNPLADDSLNIPETSK